MHLAAVRTVISRNPVSPPQLAADTPVTYIIGPVVVCSVHSRRNKLDVPVFNGTPGRLNKLVHLHEPLLFYKGLDRCTASVMGTDIMGIILDLNEKAFLF